MLHGVYLHFYIVKTYSYINISKYVASERKNRNNGLVPGT